MYVWKHVWGEMRCIISGLLSCLFRKMYLYATVLICIWCHLKMYIYLSYFHSGIYEIQSVYVTVVLLHSLRLVKINLKRKEKKKCFPVIFSSSAKPTCFSKQFSQLISNQRNKCIMLFLLSFCFGCVTFNRCNWRVEQPFFPQSFYEFHHG